MEDENQNKFAPEEMDEVVVEEIEETITNQSGTQSYYGEQTEYVAAEAQAGPSYQQPPVPPAAEAYPGTQSYAGQQPYPGTQPYPGAQSYADGQAWQAAAGAAYPQAPYVPGQYQPVWSPKSKLAAGLFGILLGSFGVHNFYLGFTGKAVAQLLITLLSFGLLSWVSAIWGLVEGILVLASETGSKWDLDAQGRPMRPIGSQS